MEAEDKRPSHRPLNWGIGIVVFLLLYVLSVGPMVCLMVNYPSVIKSTTGKIIEVIYSPLSWVVSQNRTADKVMRKYINWWVKVTGTPVEVEFPETPQP